MNQPYSYFAALYSLLILVEIWPHFKPRYLFSDLRKPWTFRQRLQQSARDAWIGALIVSILYATIIVAVTFYGVVTNKPNFWIAFLRKTVDLYLSLGIVISFRFLGKELDECRKESQSFEDVVTEILQPIKPK